MNVIYPMFALVLWTLVIGLGLGFSRFRSIKKREVDPKYFRLMADYAPPPEYSQKFARNFSNLFEVPTLFYVAGILVITLNISSSLVCALAWLFVGLRIVHSLIHVTYNNPIHRLLAFLTSFLVVVAMWVDIILFVCQ